MEKLNKENLIFNLFAETYFMKQVDFSQPKPPCPDVIFKDRNLNIGMELTELNNPKNLISTQINRNESVIRSISSKIESRIKEVFPEGLLISIQYDINKSINRKDIIDVNNFITEEILSNLKNKNPSFSIDLTKRFWSGNYNLHSVHIARLEGYFEPTEVIFGYASFIPEISSDLVNEIINIKSNKIYNKADLDEFWLLIHSGGSFGSEIIFKPIVIKQKAEFDKVFIFNFLTKQLLEY